MSAANVERARRGFDAVVSGDYEALSEFLDPAVQWHGGDPTAEGACHTSDDVVEFIRLARERGGVGELVDVIDCGDQVVVVRAAGERRPAPDGPPRPLTNGNL